MDFTNRGPMQSEQKGLDQARERGLEPAKKAATFQNIDYNIHSNPSSIETN
jgi:hypothetical protein